MYNILRSNTIFTNKLYQFISKKSDNVLFSPLGLHVILAIMLQGARNETADIIRAVLQVPDMQPSESAYKMLLKQLKGIDNTELYIANLLGIKRTWPVLPQFFEKVKEFYSAKVKLYDFLNKRHTVELINEWFERKVKMRGVVDEDFVDEEAIILLVSAVYLKGNWFETFSETYTQRYPFWLADGRTIDVEMMVNESIYIHHKYSEVLNADVVSLPFRDPRVCFVLILPREKEGIWDLEANLATVNLGKVTTKLSKTLTTLYLPKFKIETSFDASEVLKKIGLGRMFNKEKADFGGMTPKTLYTDHLCIEKIVQKVVIEINERGTDATSLMAPKFKERSSEADLKIVVDHPAIFMVERKFGESKNILFYGRLLHPRY